MTIDLQVDGTVDLRVDGAAATLTGRGPALELRSDQPATLLDGMGPAAGSIDAIGSALAEAGLLLIVTGPRGDVATLGSGVHSMLGRLVAGSSRVRLGRPAAVLPLAQARLRRAASSRNLLLGAAIAAGILLARSRRTR